jgi:hypothetical protein
LPVAWELPDRQLGSSTTGGTARAAARIKLLN